MNIGQERAFQDVYRPAPFKKKLIKKIMNIGQERAFWDVYRPAPF